MTEVSFTNIQRRTVRGSLIGLSPDVVLMVEDTSIEGCAAALESYLGDEGSPSFSWEVRGQK